MSLLRLALDSKLPEAVWMVLDNKLSTSDEIEVCFDWMFSPAGQKAFALVEDKSRQNDEGIAEEIINLLMSFGGLDRPLHAPASPSPPSLSKAERVSGAAEPSSASSDNSRPSSCGNSLPLFSNLINLAISILPSGLYRSIERGEFTLIRLMRTPASPARRRV